MNYENKTNEELIEILEEKDSQIYTLECDAQDSSDLEDEVSELNNQAEEYNTALSDRETVSESAFTAGHEAGTKGLELMRAWLNHKIEARI